MRLRTPLIGLLSFLVAGAALAGKSPRAGSGHPWNGGKQAPPVRIDAKLEPGSTPVISLRVTPTVDCANLVTEVRGVDGVAVDVPAVVQHPSCTRDGTVEQRVTVHPPEKGVGYAAVTVRFELDGRPVSVTRAVAVGAPGAARTRRLPSADAQLKQQPNGEKAIILRSQQ